MIREFTDAGLIQRMHDFNEMYHPRVAFSFVTEESNGSFILHERESQPCYGELRKYSSVAEHKGMVTDTGVKRPNDLKNPFPVTGNPVAVSFCYSSRVLTQAYDYTVSPPKPFHQANPEFVNKVIKYLHSKDSPYKKGFGLGKRVEFTETKGKLISGVIIKTGDLDPTVLVAQQIVLRNMYTKFGLLEELVSGGLEFEKAILFGSAINSDPRQGTYLPNSYSFATLNFSPDRYWNQNPQDFTGGTFYDRYDYSRPNLAYIFSAKEGEKGINICEELSKRTPIKNEQIRKDGYAYTKKSMKLEDVINAAKEVL